MDVAIADLAGRQHGVVSLAQLRGLGLAGSTVRSRVTAGRLHGVHRGVLAVGRPGLSREGRWMAAVLACGPGALLSHRAALELWGALARSGRAPEVTVPRTVHARDGITVHSAMTLHAEDMTAIDVIPCTSVARCLLDFADTARPAELARAVEECERRRIFDGHAVERALGRGTGRRGAHRLRAALAEWKEPAFTRSEAERKLLKMISDAALPSPLVNTWVAGYEVDFYWPDRALVVEVNGYAYHHTRQAIERDASREAGLDAVDLRVIRVTWTQLEHRPQGVITRLARALSPARA